MPTVFPAPESIAAAISEAPGWARVGITAPDPRVRAKALQVLADFVAEQLERSGPVCDPMQIPLPL